MACPSSGLTATAVSVNVFRIVKNLDQLAPGKYRDLFDQFKEIQGRINEVLSQRKQPKAEKLVLPFEEINVNLADQVGSKMANLGEVMNRLELPVPAGFVITSLAYQRFFEHNDLQTEIDRLLQASEVDQLDQLYSLSADIQQLIIRATVPPDLEEAIMGAYRHLEAKAGEGVKVSMRSSALGEDLAGDLLCRAVSLTTECESRRPHSRPTRKSWPASTACRPLPTG